jgi:hypothetical protein
MQNMDKEYTYDFSLSTASGLGVSVEEAGTDDDFRDFLNIRRELNQFLINLNFSNRAECAGQQVHFLFLALGNLDNLEREIRISRLDERCIDMGRIHDKIKSLKMLILNYIRHLTSEYKEEC